MAKRIENEEQYRKAMQFMVDTAIELEDPLLDGPERAKKMALYDRVDELAEQYRRGQLAKKFPGLREVYRQLGWNYEDPEAPVELEQPNVPDEPVSSPEPVPDPDPVAPEYDPEPQKESQSPEPSFWDMLDDDE